MRLLVAFIFMMQNSIVWAGPDRRMTGPDSPIALALKQVGTEIPQKKKMSLEDFLKIYEKKTSESYLKNLMKEMKPSFKEAIEFEVLGSNRFAIRDGQGNEVVTEILDLNEGFLKLNNRKVQIDFAQPAEEIVHQITQALGGRSAAHPFLHLLLPRAEAFDMGTLLIAAVGITATVGIIVNYNNCKEYDQLNNECAAVLSNGNAPRPVVLQLYEKTHKLNGSFLTFFCSNKDNVKACETNLYVRLSSMPAKNDVPHLVVPGAVK